MPSGTKPTRRRRRSPYGGAACPWCRQSLQPQPISSGEVRCHRCGRPFLAVRFEPPERSVLVEQVIEAGPEAQASCSQHQRNAAVAACRRCGRFICTLCRIDDGDDPYCPACFERLAKEGVLAVASPRLRNYAGLSSLSIVASIIFAFPFGVVFAGLGIYYAIRGLRDKRARGEADGVLGLSVRLLLAALLVAGTGLLLAVWLGAMVG